MSLFTHLRVLPVLAAVLTLNSHAGTQDSLAAAAFSQPAPETWAKQLDNLGRLYQNKNNPILQELWFLGRYHGIQHWSDGNRGTYEESWENRRFRAGFQAKLFNKLTLHAQMLSGTDMDPFYGGFTELWAQWSFSDALNLTVGQQKHRFTHDRNVSSRYINYMERSLMTNNFGLDYTPAVTLSGTIKKFYYYTGLFSNATSPSMMNSFGKLNSGWSFLAAAGYDTGKLFGADSSYIYLSYLRSDAKSTATLMNRFEHGLSAALILTKGPVSLVTEVTSGLGGTRGDAHALNVQPSFFITNNLQFVARYQLAVADEVNGLSAQRRYERNVGLTTGDLYKAGYAGFNYYIAGHRLKLMTGVEYSTLGGRDQWTAMTALRLYWGPHAKGAFPTNGTLPGAF